MPDRKQRQTLKDYCIQNDRLELLCQWHPMLNGALTPEMVTAGSTKSIWWQCPEGHVWRAVIYSRTGGNRCGCPVCAGRVKSERLKRYAALTAERPTDPGLLIKCEPLEQRTPNNIHKC